MSSALVPPSLPQPLGPSWLLRQMREGQDSGQKRERSPEQGGERWRLHGGRGSKTGGGARAPPTAVKGPVPASAILTEMMWELGSRLGGAATTLTCVCQSRADRRCHLLNLAVEIILTCGQGIPGQWSSSRAPSFAPASVLPGHG